MKKIFLSSLIFLFVLSLTACNKKENTKNNEDNNSTYPQEESNTISEEEQAFNDSGRAKAIESETDLWPYYFDEESGLSFNYPGDINFEDQVDNDLDLSLDIIKIEELEGTMGFDRDTAMNNQVALANASYGEEVDFPFELSKKTKVVGDRYAQDFVVFSRFEVCDKRFERVLYFFNNAYQIKLSLSANPEKMISENSAYFTKDSLNCGDELVWDREKLLLFYNSINKQNDESLAKRWFEVFEKITDSIELEAKKSRSELILGEWMSVDDKKSRIEFMDAKKIDFYDGEKISEASFSFSADEEMLSVGEAQDKFEYKVLEISKYRLVLSALPRGNTLEYSRIKHEQY